MKRPFLIVLLFYYLLLTVHVIPVNAQPVINSGWAASPPTIDGKIDPYNEWAAAGTGTHTWKIIHHGGSWIDCNEEGLIIMYVMNDAFNLYILLEIHDVDPQLDTFFLYFDNTNNHQILSDDSLVCWAPSSFQDRESPGTGGPYSNIQGLTYGSDYPGDQDGEAAATQVDLGTCSKVWYVEFSHPLCSGNLEGADICLTFGDTVGFQVGWWDNFGWPDPSKNYWPDTNGITVYNRPPADVDEWGDIIIAGPPKSLGKPPHGPVGGDFYAIDKPSILAPYLTGIIVAIATVVVMLQRRKHLTS